MAAYPNMERKRAGGYVRNVHPCNAGRIPDGIVVDVDEELGTVLVSTGAGSTVYGPAENWEPIWLAPDWLALRIEAGELLAGKSCSDRDFLAPLLEEA